MFNELKNKDDLVCIHLLCVAGLFYCTVLPYLRFDGLDAFVAVYTCIREQLQRYSVDTMIMLETIFDDLVQTCECVLLSDSKHMDP